MRLTRKSVSSIALCGALFIATCGAGNCNPTPPATVNITIFHTNDIHSHFKPEPFNSEKNPYNLGGLAKLKTLVSQLRAQKPNSLLLDAGDWSEATSYFNIDAGSNMLEIMSQIGYDAAVVGNHDFLNGPSELANTVERAKPSFAVLGENMNLTALTPAEQTRITNDVIPYKIFTVAGVKIAVIGILCDDFFYYGYFAPGVITDPVTTATTIAENLHNTKQADVIVLLSHNSINLNVTWAQTVPWVNVVISGHTHAKTPQPITTTNGGNPAYIAETKQWGQFLGDMTLTVTPSTGQVVLQSYTLHPVTSDIADDPTVAATIAAQDAALATKYGKAITSDHAADSDDELAHDDNREVPLSNMTSDAYRAATGSDIAIESVQLNGDGIQPGPLSTFQLMNIAPHIYHPVAGQTFPQSGSTWTLKKLPIQGTALRGILNFSFLTDSLGLIGWMAQSGAHITWNPSGGASQVQDIQILNAVTNTYEELDDNATYQLAFHDGIEMALGIIVSKLGINIDLTKAVETGIPANQAVVNYVTGKGIPIRAADYLPGTRYSATIADLAIFDSDVQSSLSGSTGALMVTVHNIGLAASPASTYTLNVAASPPNDVLTDFAYNTPDETTSLGILTLPSIAPGQSATVQIPWNNAAAGIYQVQFTIGGGTIANPANATFIHHVHLGVP